MRSLFAVFITACIVLAAAQALAGVLAILLLIALIYGLFTAPRETLGLLDLSIVATLVTREPLACLGVVTVLAVVSLIHRAR